ncbi:DUF2076 domain-containing protein [Acerihabitans sp. TG2]|uniref:DUF2076 domain-containing protein n=1 Tax=Acerihabitans sp. TG2 TaxID=3096008 RepID=UPI002B228F4E|nr:DUF2076 domain-containing protein [Acerihabitans sp. TG2]MEA9390756.1 DUF2076 domain-containing protein [Acerihabitans sp. TG2]
MQSEEQRLIEGLFQRLKQTEQQAGPRDTGADRQIQEFIQLQPAAPYYMAQSILIQEAALKNLHQQVQQLEAHVTALKNASAPSGGFLSNLFGGGASRTSRPQEAPMWNNQPQHPSAGGYGAPQTPPPGYNGYAQGYGQPPVQAPARGSGFMAGALQTAAGVAGGMVLGNMLTGMFHNSRPEEIVNVIQQPLDAATDPLTHQDFSSDNLDTFNDVSDSRFLGNNGMGITDRDVGTDDNFADTRFGADNDFGTNDDFNDDDDSFV